VDQPVAGEVVVIPFRTPILPSGKRRPALVIADLPGRDLILCQITSPREIRCFLLFRWIVAILSADTRPAAHSSATTFHVEHRVILYSIGKVQRKLNEVLGKVRALF